MIIKSIWRYKLHFNLGSITMLPYFAFVLFISFTACASSKKKNKQAKANFAALQNEVKKQNEKETKGEIIDGYILQDNDRIYFNAFKNYLISNYDTAFVGFTQYSNLDTTNATTFYYLAQIKGRYNLFKETISDAQKAVKLSPGNKWMQSYYAGWLAFSEQYDSAASIFLDIGKKNLSDRESSFFAAAKLYQRAGNTDKAIAVLDTLQTYHGTDDEEILQEKQTIYLRAGDFEKAIKITQQLIDAYPLSPEYMVQMVEIYELDKEPVKSQETVELLEKKFGSNDDVSSYIFGYYLKKRNVDKIAKTMNDYVDAAEKTQDKELIIISQISQYISSNRTDTTVLKYLSEVTEGISKQKPKNITAKRLLASLNLYGVNRSEGVKIYNDLIEQHPQNYSMWSPLVDYYMYYGKGDTAMIYLMKMVKKFPDSSQVPLNMMFIEQDKKNYNQALKYGLTGLDLAQKQKNVEQEINFLNSIANLYNELKNHEASDSVYDEILIKDPENTMALNNYAYFLSERGERLDFALNLSKKTLEVDMENPNNLDTYGWILYKMKRYEEAKYYLEKAIIAAGDNVSVVVLEHYADVEFRLGNVDKALKIWKDIDKAGEGSEFLKKKIKDKTIYE